MMWRRGWWTPTIPTVQVGAVLLSMMAFPKFSKKWELLFPYFFSEKMGILFTYFLENALRCREVYLRGGRPPDNADVSLMGLGHRLSFFVCVVSGRDRHEKWSACFRGDFDVAEAWMVDAGCQLQPLFRLGPFFYARQELGFDAYNCSGSFSPSLIPKSLTVFGARVVSERGVLGM